MRSNSSLSNNAPGRNLPLLSKRASISDLKRPVSARGFRPQSPRTLPSVPRSRPGSSMGSRPSTPSFRPEPYTGNITVSIRPNPHSKSVHDNWEIESSSNTITNLLDNSSFSFDHIFPATTDISNKEVYMKLCSQLVKSFLDDGYNSTLFAYGMTGSGKTYSMRGEDSDPGFVRLAIDEIFEKIASAGTSRKHQLSASYLEIYNERIVDLLSNNPSQSDLKIRDDPQYGTQIVGASIPPILSKEHLLLLIRTGDNKRKTSATDYNARSSRSHAILQLRLHVVDVLSNKESHCTLSLCDLAGSERAASSLERRKEGAFINKSLLALSTVINKLSLISTSPAAMEHIPYRDSKLTRLLQPALSGSSLVLILCTIHLGSNQSQINLQFISETYNTLRFAARAKDIVMTVKTNEKAAFTDTEAQKIVAELQRTVEAQKSEIQMLKMAPSAAGSVNDVEIAGLRAEISVLNEKLEHFSRLNDLQKTETILLRNDALNDILGIDAEKAALQMMMSNLEEFYKRVNYELEEYKQYIGHLELQLKNSRQQAFLLNQDRKIGRGMSDNNYDAMLKEQEEEIWQLQETIKDKDRIIYGLTKTSKLRRLVDTNSASVSDLTKRPSFSSPAPSTSSPGKENLFTDIKAFNLSPTREF